ncbi:hypothetical protein LJR034_007588 [Caballeronia sp. LjRoot34]|uniref:hypothetical protein n=1 Tax=Caballeronia sp. LjRoot34 TaxID=3342325 RepID=UPI003ECFE1FD
MVSRLLRVSLALILAGAASAALAEGGAGIGHAGTYPPQYGPNTPSNKDLLDVRKEKREQANRAVVADASSDVGGTANVVSQSGVARATAAPAIYSHH